MNHIIQRNTGDMNTVCMTVLRIAVFAVGLCWNSIPSFGQVACPNAVPGTLCLDQPQSGDTKISGQVKKGPVDIKVNGTVYRNIKVINHKFSKTVPALGADLTVMATLSGAVFPPAGLTVWGHGLCQTHDDAVCVEVPVIGENAVTVKGGTAGIPAGYKLFLNKAPGVQPVTLGAIGSGGDLAVTIRLLTPYDVIELDDSGGGLVAGPLAPQAAKQTPACSQTSRNLPCLKPVKSTDKSVAGFGAPGSTVDISVNNVDKGKPNVDAATGAFTLELSSLAKGQTVAATQVSPAPPAGAKPATTTVADAPASKSLASLYTLGLAGVDVAGSTNTGASQQYFASFDTRLPLPFLGQSACASPNDNYVVDYKCWVWFNPRIASAPTPSSSAIKSFSSPSSLATGINGETLGQMAQTVEIQSGMEYALFHGPRVPTSNTVAFRGALSIIFGGGVVTPINSTSNASIFTLNTNLGNQFTQNSLATNNSPTSFANTYPTLASALCSHFGYTSTPACTPSAVAYSNVAFVLPNRSRFFRDYFGGIRLRTYFFAGDCTKKTISAQADTATSCEVANVHPGTFDIRFGQDETVTAGFRRGVVMTLAGSYPLPGTAGAVRIFGSMYMRLHHNENTPTLALLPASSTVNITDATVVLQPIAPSDHDYYRLGIGVDLVPLVTKWTSTASNSGSSPASSSSQ